MKRKTIVIVGLTGTLLAGTALTGLMVNAYLSPQKMSISSEIRNVTPEIRSNSPQPVQALPRPAQVEQSELKADRKSVV